MIKLAVRCLDDCAADPAYQLCPDVYYHRQADGTQIGLVGTIMVKTLGVDVVGSASPSNYPLKICRRLYAVCLIEQGNIELAYRILGETMPAGVPRVMKRIYYSAQNTKPLRKYLVRLLKKIPRASQVEGFIRPNKIRKNGDKSVRSNNRKLR